MSDYNAFVNPVVRGVINPNKTITYKTKNEIHKKEKPMADNASQTNLRACR